jgi:hypothetical protein
MTTDADHLLRARFALTTPDPDPADWPDVVRRSRGVEGSPRRDTRRRALLLVAALLGVLVVAGSAIAISGSSTGIPAIDDLLDKASRPALEAPPFAPGRDVRPVPGSISAPLAFDSDGIRFTAVGFRSRNGMICSAQVDSAATPERPTGGVGCLSERLLRKALDDSPVHVFAGGGGAHQAFQGFARADVVGLALADAGAHGNVGLSEPWKPEPWAGEPIRFFYAIVPATEAEGSNDAAPWHVLPLKATMANGDSVEIRP